MRGGHGNVLGILISLETRRDKRFSRSSTKRKLRQRWSPWSSAPAVGPTRAVSGRANPARRTAARVRRVSRTWYASARRRSISWKSRSYCQPRRRRGWEILRTHGETVHDRQCTPWSGCRTWTGGRGGPGAPVADGATSSRRRSCARGAEQTAPNEGTAWLRDARYWSKAPIGSMPRPFGC